MKYGAIAGFGVTAFLVATMSLISINQAFAGSYEKSQSILQTNECGNYWFPVNVICSNINPQAQGDENNVVIATSPAPDKNYEPPFP